MAADSPDFYLFTTYLWDNGEGVDRGVGYGNHYYLPLHRTRLIAAAKALGWADAVEFLSRLSGFEQLVHVIEEHLRAEHDANKAFRKVKVCVYKDIRFHVESVTITPGDARDTFSLPANLNGVPSSARLCIVALDTEPITPSLFTTHKTSERTHYDRARRKAGIEQTPPSMAEVLLFNPQNEIMECSMSTPYFLRYHRWVTPPLSSGGNSGVTRGMAVASGRCEEQVVQVESLHHKEVIWISNGVRGFIQAVMHLENSA